MKYARTFKLIPYSANVKECNERISGGEFLKKRISLRKSDEYGYKSVLRTGQDEGPFDLFYPLSHELKDTSHIK